MSPTIATATNTDKIKLLQMACFASLSDGLLYECVQEPKGVFTFEAWSDREDGYVELGKFSLDQIELDDWSIIVDKKHYLSIYVQSKWQDVIR